MTSTVVTPLAWTTDDRISLSYFADNPGLKKTLLKMLVDARNSSSSNSTTSNKISKDVELKPNKSINREAIKDFLSIKNSPLNASTTVINDMSLLKFLAINALELSAPASPLLLEQTNHSITPGWLQLAGHPKSIAPAANGIVRKRVTGLSDSEVIAYRGLTADLYGSKIIPKFFGVRDFNSGDYFIELQDLLHGFKEPNVMDIKMGCRTFLESEVDNPTLRADLYKKMIAVDPTAPTAEEHALQAITKLRYMSFREATSSSQTKGFRIEAMKIKGLSPITDLKTVKSSDDVERVFEGFLQNHRPVTKELIKRLRQMRSYVEKSDYFQRHEVVGSSIFIVYDNEKVGAWMIDFAKSHTLPQGVKVTHRRPWQPGNYEEGLLHGFDELIKAVENVYHAPSKY